MANVMAQVLPAKRSRALTNGLDAVGGHAGRQTRDKRPRHSSPEPSRQGTPEDAVSQEEHSQEVDADEADETAHMEAQATQMIERSYRMGTRRENTPAECGIIEEIKCTNFMCHEQLTVTLGPLINFIIGHNGSGKSAVLTALTLCLGGKATATNRGQNLKAFIKEGRDYSTLSVRIKNQGSMAYKGHLYGDSIIVERTFSKSGSSGFKLKDQNGKIVSTKKADLEDIIDAHSLQIDNPMNVLTQDMARQFLNDSTPKEKYKFFLKGTQLEHLHQDYQQITCLLEETMNKKEMLQWDVKVLAEKHEQAVKKAKKAEELKALREQENQIAQQAAWAMVEQEEEILRDLDREIARLSEKIASSRAQADEASNEYEQANQAYEAAQQNLQDCHSEFQPMEQNVSECNARWSDLKGKRIGLQATQRGIAAQINQRKKAVADIKQKKSELEQRQAEADNGRHAEKASELEQARIASAEAKRALVNHNNTLATLEQQLKSAQDRKVPAAQRVDRKRQEEQRSKRSIDELERGQRKWIEAYPYSSNLDKLLKAIEQDRRFKERPVGPMGRYVELLKPEWAHILEKQFGNSLNAFVVTSKSDQTILSEMMRKYNYPQPIFIGSSNHINTSQNEPDSSLLTWMRALKIHNELVRNQLIINQAIDQTVLIAKRSEAENFMYNDTPLRRNAKRCFTMADHGRRMGHIISVNAATGSTSISPIGEWTNSLRMKADKGPQIQEEKTNLRIIQQEIRGLEEEAQEIQRELEGCVANLRNHKQEKKNLTLLSQKAQQKEEDLDGELSTATPDAAAMEQLRVEQKQAEQDLKFSQEQYQDMVVSRDRLDESCHSAKRELESMQEELQDIKVKIGKAEAKVSTLSTRRDAALRNKNRVLEDVKATEKNREEWQGRRDQQAEEVRKVETEAAKTCPRVEVPPGQTYQSLHSMLQAKEKSRTELEKSIGGSQEVLLAKARETQKQHKDAAKRLKYIDNVRQSLNHSLETRQYRWNRFRKEITVRAKVRFNYLLLERNFRGNLAVEHERGLLDLQIQPDITNDDEAGRQTKTLSGGEKSYSTICLLLALWDAMGSPIRCLDEFDVFMDNVNRNISMKMIIQAARLSQGRQFIFITPQSMNEVHSKGDVKIIRMGDPERGQQTLNVPRTR